MDLLKITLCFVLLSAAGWAGPANAILFDRSGSMKPYYEDQTVRRIGTALVASLQDQGSPALLAFSREAQAVARLDDLERLPFGDSTLLDRALYRAQAIGAGSVWMITDNIQDSPGSAEAGNTEQFYQRLRSDAVERVTIFPLRQPAGRPGLVVYALLLRGGASDRYDAGLAAFQRRAAGVLRTEALRMKPLDKDTIGIAWVRANVNPRTSLITYETGKPVRELIEIKFKSKFDHIEITDSTIAVAAGTAAFGKDSLVYPARRRIDISPRTVERLGPGSETEQVYKIDVDLGELRLRHDLLSLWKAAWVRSREDATLQLEFSLGVPQRNLRLRPEVLQAFHAATVEEAKRTGKIYAVDQLPSLMSGSVTEVQATSPVVFRVRYPAYPAFLWLTVFALAVAALGALWAFREAARRGVGFLMRGEWEIEARTVAGTPVENTLRGGAILVDREPVGRVNREMFLPATGIRVLHPHSAPVALSDGLEISLEAGRRSLVLRFRKKKKRVPGAKPIEAPAQPRRR